MFRYTVLCTGSKVQIQEENTHSVHTVLHNYITAAVSEKTSYMTTFPTCRALYLKQGLYLLYQCIYVGGGSSGWMVPAGRTK